ncbi:hypothetical protein WJX72_005516 [[Myrmecia] bisecta]|uniref:Uncharacterized protein n=1 Tax=[Myrmecia] bisecta TaxID=41462 RepID=A0AAW1Q6A9_9CHLO
MSWDDDDEYDCVQVIYRDDSKLLATHVPQTGLAATPSARPQHLQAGEGADKILRQRLAETQKKTRQVRSASHQWSPEAAADAYFPWGSSGARAQAAEDHATGHPSPQQGGPASGATPPPCHQTTPAANRKLMAWPQD